MECMAFTPHSENVDIYSEFTCDVCGQDIKNYDNYCGRCGYVFSEDDINGLDSYEQTVHGEGCHHSLPGGMNPDFQVSYLRDLDQTYAEQVLDEFVAALSSEDRIRLWGQIQYHRNYNCGCPAITIYLANNRISVRTWSVYSMDCSNAMEWDITMCCPICHEESIFSDGNC
jgi:hypothetical protein